jgi:hypothetical protein
VCETEKNGLHLSNNTLLPSITPKIVKILFCPMQPDMLKGKSTFEGPQASALCIADNKME